MDNSGNNNVQFKNMNQLFAVEMYSTFLNHVHMYIMLLVSTNIVLTIRLKGSVANIDL